jgi:integrase/recombinase XerD
MNEHYTNIQAEYKNWLDTLGFSKGLVNSYPQRVGDFFKWLETQGVNHIKQLTEQHIKKYYLHLEERPSKHRAETLSISYLNKNFTTIDKLLEFLNGQGVKNIPIPINHRIKPNKQEEINKIHPLTQSEIKELYTDIENTYLRRPFLQRETNHYQLKLIFTLYYGCGMRRNEGYNLTFDDVNFDNRTVFVRQGKNYKDRFIPMSERVYEELQNYIYNFRHKQDLPHKRLFVHSPNYLLKMLKHLQKTCSNQAIQSKTITIHLLRHSIATHLLQNGMSVENIARFLGHSGLEATQIYTHIVNEL